LPEEFIWRSTPAPAGKITSQFDLHSHSGEAIMRLSRLVRETLDKLPFPEDVTVTVDVVRISVGNAEEHTRLLARVARAFPKAGEESDVRRPACPGRRIRQASSLGQVGKADQHPQKALEVGSEIPKIHALDSDCITQ